MSKKELYVQGKPFKLSRSRIEKFIQCPRCFYLEMVHGLRKFQIPFTLNCAVDTLLKSEFDIYRDRQTPHPSMAAIGLNARPFAHADLGVWRNPFKGISWTDDKHGFHLYGGIDDLWEDLDDGALIVADYKATSKPGGVDLNSKWCAGYKRQLEIYQWLFRQNGFKVSDFGYFVYANANKELCAFNNCLNFEVKLMKHEGHTDWIEGVLDAIKATLDGDLPAEGAECLDCKFVMEAYRVIVGQSYRDAVRK